MTYAVHHVDADGGTRLEDVASLEDALALVERLRNDGAVSEVRVLKEVPIEVRTYYRVVAVEEDRVAAPLPEPEPVHAVAVQEGPPSGAVVMGPPPAAVAEDVGSAAEVHGEPRRTLFSRG